MLADCRELFSAAMQSRGMRGCIAAALAAVIVSISSGFAAQSAAPPEVLPSFEVASVKRSGGDLSGRLNSSTILTALPGRLVITNMTVRGMIRNAYGFFIPTRDDVVGGPQWVDEDRWDVEATVAGVQAQARKLLMLQRLLTERFKLVVRRQTTQVDTYALVLDRRDGRLGPGLRAAPECVRIPGSASDSGRPCGGRGGSGRVTGTGLTTSRLAELLASSADRPVTDQTGLTGTFDVDLTWSQDVGIFTALKEQLGLKLEAGPSVTRESIVIDRVERPSEN
jgi:uncharacterized protein (TIGR03435 family)